jgi:hypothetical protein
MNFNFLVLFVLNLVGTTNSFSINTEHRTRRTFFLETLLPTSVFTTCVLTAGTQSANANSVPLVGRFEPLKGAKSFIGSWKYEATKGTPEGVLVFLKNGEVELRSSEDSSTVIAVGAVPWKYVSPKGSDTMVVVTFTLDNGEDDVLIFDGLVDSVGGPDRVLQGTISKGRAEIGARGGGPLKEIGSFKSSFLQ